MSKKTNADGLEIGRALTKDEVTKYQNEQRKLERAEGAKSPKKATPPKKANKGGKSSAAKNAAKKAAGNS